MSWDDIEIWRADAPLTRPSSSAVDGFLTGSILSFDESDDDATINAIIGAAEASAPANKKQKLAAEHLAHRLDEIRRALSDERNSYAPMLTLLDNGDFDLTEWATGFLEAVGPDLDLWLYLLQGKREAGQFGLIGAHAAGPMGQAAREWIAKHEDHDRLNDIVLRQWEFIPSLLRTLYRTRLANAANSR
ncbi:hypothetical protein B2G71_19380 [Novosphingobium sp. PC22D]|uniref:UPF0149 family protein n=1 Tax=Novosphingobium sp. PC22D TaxID=1962403 RepID=UPI000BF1413D|nr:UPF0149 family protein [Novosphingobium sp. PC22D]PEQ10981.1 hypothetical protein B2G71_19380 [Novosphingobium sp. PC22D]